MLFTDLKSKALKPVPGAEQVSKAEYKLFQQALKETPKGRWSHVGEKVRRSP